MCNHRTQFRGSAYFFLTKIYLFEKQNYKSRGTEKIKSKLFLLLINSPNAYTSLSKAILKPLAKNSCQVSHMGEQGLGSSCPASQAQQREAGSEAEAQLYPKHPNMGCKYPRQQINPAVHSAFLSGCLITEELRLRPLNEFKGNAFPLSNEPSLGRGIEGAR